MKLNEKIYLCRKKAGLSQDALAERLGVSRQAISKWETGESVPDTGKLLPLANALGVSLDWLLSEDGTRGSGRRFSRAGDGRRREHSQGAGLSPGREALVLAGRCAARSVRRVLHISGPLSPSSRCRAC